MLNGIADNNSTKRQSRCKLRICLAGTIALLVVVDRLIYLRQFSHWMSAGKGVYVIYRSCNAAVAPISPAKGEAFIKCAGGLGPGSNSKFVEYAHRFTVFPGGCEDKTVLAWSQDVRYWLNTVLPGTSRPQRIVIFEDGHIERVAYSRFAALNCRE